MSAYANDPRVVWVSERKVELSDGWRVWYDMVLGKWVVNPQTARRPFDLYDSVDDGIRSRIGEPQVTP